MEKLTGENMLEVIKTVRRKAASITNSMGYQEEKTVSKLELDREQFQPQYDELLRMADALTLIAGSIAILSFEANYGLDN